MEHSANKSLVSLLRNSVLLEISTDKLAIGYTNTGLFSAEKKKEIEDAARAFFNKQIKVSYQENTNGIDESVRQKLQKEKMKKIEAIKKEAEMGENVQSVLKHFPGSTVKSIELSEEIEDV